MSRLISNANICLEHAIEDYDKSKKVPQLSDSYIGWTCFHLQQAIEFFLKAIIELEGNTYVENHDLRACLNRVVSNVQLDETYDKIRQNAETFNKWEGAGRYELNFLATIKDINIAFECAETLKTYCNSLIKTNT